MIKVIVDGMTASGKSTMVEALSNELDLKLFPEQFRAPLDLLTLFHHDQKNWAYPMQLNFLFSRITQYLVALKGQDCMMDRSHLS